MKRNTTSGEKERAIAEPNDGQKHAISEGARVRSVANAAGRRRMESEKGISGFIRTIARVYKRADEVVSMPFLIILSVILSLAVFFGSRPGTIPTVRAQATSTAQTDLGQGTSKEWKWVQGVGKDVVGKVNCTTYLHAPSGTLVELGHGSGGGITFKIGEKGQISWVWHDGLLENQESFACPDIEAKLRSGEGRPGTPKALMMNRYGKVFWVGTAHDDGIVTYRNANNPINLELTKDGFIFTSSKLNVISVLNGVLNTPAPPKDAGSVHVVDANETAPS